MGWGGDIRNVNPDEIATNLFTELRRSRDKFDGSAAVDGNGRVLVRAVVTDTPYPLSCTFWCNSDDPGRSVAACWSMDRQYGMAAIGGAYSVKNSWKHGCLGVLLAKNGPLLSRWSVSRQESVGFPEKLRQKAVWRRS